jgi:hypothetical protein
MPATVDRRVDVKGHFGMAERAAIVNATRAEAAERLVVDRLWAISRDHGDVIPDAPTTPIKCASTSSAILPTHG